VELSTWKRQGQWARSRVAGFAGGFSSQARERSKSQGNYVRCLPLVGDISSKIVPIKIDWQGLVIYRDISYPAPHLHSHFPEATIYFNKATIVEAFMGLKIRNNSILCCLGICGFDYYHGLPCDRIHPLEQYSEFWHECVPPPIWWKHKRPRQ
jgi:hypothetical protein